MRMFGVGSKHWPVPGNTSTTEQITETSELNKHWWAQEIWQAKPFSSPCVDQCGNC